MPHAWPTLRTLAIVHPGRRTLAQRLPAAATLFLAPGATLAPDAAQIIRAALAAHPEATLFTADEHRIAPDGTRTPHLKPAWSNELALEQDLVGPALILRRPIIAALGHPTPDPAAPLQDLALRAIAAGARPHHIPGITATWPHPTHTGPSHTAIADFLATRPPAEILPNRFDPTLTRIRWTLPNPPPHVSILIPTRDNAPMLARCLDGLLHRTADAPLEILIADNGSTDPAACALLDELGRTPRIRVLPHPGPFNYSAINNRLASQARGDILILLNDDVEVTHPDWLAEMVGHAIRPEIGAVGARLLYPNGTIQHAGIVLGVGRFENGPGLAGHFGLAAPATDPGYANQFITTRQVSAVTAACLAIRHQVWIEIGGLDEANLPIALNDVDLCLRLRARGLGIVYTPFAELLHHESASRGSDQAPEAADRFQRECRWLRDRWGDTLHNDPFYNPAFSRFDHSFLLQDPVPS